MLCHGHVVDAVSIIFLQTSFADEKFPPEEVGQNVATPTDGLVLEAENIAEVHTHTYTHIHTHTHKHTHV